MIRWGWGRVQHRADTSKRVITSGLAVIQPELRNSDSSWISANWFAILANYARSLAACKDFLAVATHSGFPAHITRRKPLSARKPSVGSAQVAKKSRASLKLSLLCHVVKITSFAVGPVNRRSPRSSLTMISSTMSCNLSQSGPQAQKYTIPQFRAVDAKLEIASASTLVTSAATSNRNRLVGNWIDEGHLKSGN